MKTYQYFDTNPVFGLEALQTGKQLLHNESKQNIDNIRHTLLEVAKAELEHFKNLTCMHTFIKSVEEKPVSSRKNSSDMYTLKVKTGSQVSHLSTMMGSCATVSDSDEPSDSCSVSSDSDSNEVDLDDLISNDISVTIVDDNNKGKPKKGTKNIPMFFDE